MIDRGLDRGYDLGQGGGQPGESLGDQGRLRVFPPDISDGYVPRPGGRRAASAARHRANSPRGWAMFSISRSVLTTALASAQGSSTGRPAVVRSAISRARGGDSRTPSGLRLCRRTTRT